MGDWPFATRRARSDAPHLRSTGGRNFHFSSPGFNHTQRQLERIPALWKQTGFAMLEIS